MNNTRQPHTSLHMPASSAGAAIAAKYAVVYTDPPRKSHQFTLSRLMLSYTDEPLLGNGDLRVAMGGEPDRLRFTLTKADLWELRNKRKNPRLVRNSEPRLLGWWELIVPALEGASYRVSQDLCGAVTTGVFTRNGAILTVETAVAATENTQWLRISAKGGTFTGEARLFSHDAQPAPSDSTLQILERRIDTDVLQPTAAACALRVLGHTGCAFSVTPGQPVLVLVAVSGLANTPDYRPDAVKRAGQATAESVATTQAAHSRWWADFWARSFIEISDKVLEKHYYLSNYTLASASRLAHFPPGLYGWLTTDEAIWGGTNYNNYNGFAPYYGLYAGNHVEQAMPCNDYVIDYLDTGRLWCKDECGFDTGVVMPASSGPLGFSGTGTTWRQRSNASYACIPLASTWYATYDVEFARRAYPFVREVTNFWEQWLKLENGRYVDHHDAVLEECERPDENDLSQDVNPIQSLAFIRLVMDLAIDMSATLGVDADRHSKWADIRDRMSDYPQCTLGDLPENADIRIPRTADTLGLPVFRYTESGTAWQRNNSVGIQHIFPGNGIGLGVRPELLERARSQITVMGRWVDGNGCNSFFPAAARVGYNPHTILARLSHWVETTAPNGMRPDNPHGMEHYSVVPSTLQEMLLQSYDGVLRFFPCWPNDHAASFGTLRARGAFLVSAELKEGKVCGVRIISEKGRDCTLVNPWPGKNVSVIRNPSANSGHGSKTACAKLAKPAETVSGDRFTLKTDINETIVLEPRE